MQDLPIPSEEVLCKHCKHCGKRRKYWLSFSHNVFTHPKTIFIFLQVTFILLSANAFDLEQSKLLFGKELTLNHTNPTLNNLLEKAISKTLWGNQKILVTSISLFSNSDLYSLKSQFHHSTHLLFVVCKFFEFLKGLKFCQVANTCIKNSTSSSSSYSSTKKASPVSPSFIWMSTGSPLISMSTWNDIKLVTSQRNFTLVQIPRVCRQHINFCYNGKIRFFL